MRILSVIKQVPDSNAAIKIAADGKSLDDKGLKLVLNPFSEFGVEQAVQIREQGATVEEIVAMTAGPDKASEVLRTALAMGADRGIHLNDPAFCHSDEIFLAELFAAAIKAQPDPFDIVLVGKQAIDMDSGEIGPALAEFLGIPHIGAIVGLEVTESGVKARRRIEGAEEVVTCPFPVLMTCEKGLVEPRYPSLPNLMKAKKKPVEVLTAANLPGAGDLQSRSEITALTPPAERGTCRFVEGEPAEMARELVRLLREEAKVI
jgi:electron transfer flavoprotein beta subunit